jgi:hypothetical protein
MQQDAFKMQQDQCTNQNDSEPFEYTPSGLRAASSEKGGDAV